MARRIIDEADAAKNLFRKPATRNALTLGLMRTLDRPRTIALLKPLTGTSDIALRLVGVDEPADARIVSKNLLRADEHFVPLWVERYVAALPPSHPLTLKERLRTTDLAGVAMIDRCHCEQSELFGRAASASRQPAAIAESEDWAMALVAAGVGIAIVPEERGARQFRCRRARDRRRREAPGRPRLQRRAAAVRGAAKFHRETAEPATQSGPRQIKGSVGPKGDVTPLLDHHGTALRSLRQILPVAMGALGQCDCRITCLHHFRGSRSLGRVDGGSLARYILRLRAVASVATNRGMG